MATRRDEMVTITVRLGDLEEAHPDSHELGWAHCPCTIAVALRDQFEAAHPGTPEYKKVYGLVGEG